MHLYLSKVECHHSFFYFIFLISRVVLILLKTWVIGWSGPYHEVLF